MGDKCIAYNIPTVLFKWCESNHKKIKLMSLLFCAYAVLYSNSVTVETI